MTISPSKNVSVIVPNYNYARFLRKRIKSIVEQTYPIYELIILDDASTDESAGVIRDILSWVKEKYPEIRLKYLENEMNSGKAILQWKKGFEVATGDYIWIAEADDLCSRYFLAETMRGFDDPDVVLSYTESKLINKYGLIIAPNFRWSRDKERTGHYAESYTRSGICEIKEIMAIRCTIPNVSAVVFKKDKKIPFLQYLDEATKYTQVGDWYFYTKVLEHGKLRYNFRALNKFRIHGRSVTGKSRQGREHYDEVAMMHRRFEENYDLAQEVLVRMKNERKRIRERIKER